MDHALYLRSNQINQDGTETEHIMGHTCSRRTFNNVMHKMSESHLKSLEDFIATATDRKWQIVLIIDDYTAIHTKRRPQKEKLPEAKTMCTLAVKAFKDIQAVPATHALCTHDQNGIDIESCVRLITAASSMHDISNSYASVMPDWLTKAFFNPERERHRLNIHQYCENENVRMMRKMDDLHLLGFVELRLKSKGDFDTAYDVAMSTGLATYLKKFTVLQPRGWPCQFYYRQIIYESLRKFVSSHPGFSDIPPRQDLIPSDHSSYSFPMTSDEYPVENTHSIPRSQTKGSDTADELRKKAKSIFQSKDKQSHYSQSQTYNQPKPSPKKAPPYSRRCHHPVRGHKRKNNVQVKCHFCENGICTVSDNVSCSNCLCLWHTANLNESIQSTCDNQSAPLPRPDSQTTLRINVTVAKHLDVTEWLLPSYICQSSLGGRPSGSNACTVISVLAALHFLEGTLQIPKQLQDLSITIPMFTNLMIKGNQLYDSFTLPVQQPNLEVRSPSA
ncbi:hypothetical protein AWC38_SpisGene8656 [Stylophora pistillata]|uniref:Uncharacterized protein n=1 Tax=Stylophora pistillata TaxID=50429 RepID=A0A2B4SC88_STYPI|nr:hypothetical protein AWC38_SpisGene8656 [Stylophora pistillata]